jgi:hypothetical protein
MNRCQAIKRNGKPCKQQGDNVIDCYCQYHHKFRIKKPEPPKKIMIDASTQTETIEPPKPIEQPKPIEPKQNEPVKLTAQDKRKLNLLIIEYSKSKFLSSMDCFRYNWKDDLQGYRCRMYFNRHWSHIGFDEKPTDEDLYKRHDEIKKYLNELFVDNTPNIEHPKIHMIKKYEVC